MRIHRESGDPRHADRHSISRGRLKSLAKESNGLSERPGPVAFPAGPRGGLSATGRKTSPAAAREIGARESISPGSLRPSTTAISRVPRRTPPGRGSQRGRSHGQSPGGGPPPAGGDERDRIVGQNCGPGKTATERPATARFSLSAAGPERADEGGGPAPGRLSRHHRHPCGWD